MSKYKDENLELWKYEDENGNFDYEQYKLIQTRANRKKIQRIWVIKKNIAFLSEYIKSKIENPQFGICHGTRRGNEQAWFREFLNCEVIGTEISDTATDFPHTIQWDFHEVKDEWIGSVDFIYSNSFDHSYDPKKCINAWMKCLNENGMCIIEHTPGHEKAKISDPFGAALSKMPSLIYEWGDGRFSIQETLIAPEKPPRLAYCKFLIIKKNTNKE